MTAQDLTQTIARHIAGTSFSALPATAVTAAKRTLFDTLAVAMAGRDQAGAREAREMMLAQGGARESRLWGTDRYLPAMSAAFANGTAAAALDFDSLHEGGTVHADIAVAPAVLALAESRNASGTDVLAALVLGNDLAARLGMSTREHKGWFYSSLHGAFAAAAVSARIIGLDAAGVRNALGIALSRTGGTQQPAQEKALTKRLQTAFVAHDGVFAALLAERGVTGPGAALEGAFGFYAMYEKGDPAVVLADLGRRYENENVSFKAFPSCACNHAIIVAAKELVARHGLTADDVASVRAVVTPYMNRLVGAPFAPGANPQVAAQFSAQYSIASVLLYGDVGLSEIHPDTVADPRVADLVARTEIQVDDNESGEFGPAVLSIATRDGRGHEARVDAIPGRPDTPLSDAGLIAKADTCLPRGNAARLFDLISSLDGGTTVRAVLDELDLAATPARRA